MTTPNFFMADLPAEATLTPAMLEEACRTLRRNREQYLVGRTTEQMIDLLVRVAQDWLDPQFPLRQQALEQGPSKSGFSGATIEHGLTGFFSQVTAKNLRGLIEQDLGAVDRLDALLALGPEEDSGRMSVASAPELLIHIAAGNLPNPTFMSMLLGVLLRSAQFIKCATGGTFLPLLFAHSLYQADRKVGACLELATWHGGDHPLERVLFQQADCLTATGSDESLARIRLRIPPGLRYVEHGHHVSFGFVSHTVKTSTDWERAVRGTAADVAAWNQLGCLSPHVIYVQTGALHSPDEFAASLALELERLESAEPRGALPAEGSALIASRRSIYALRAANSPDTRLWASENSTAWTVVFENDPRFQGSCLNRFVYVKRVRNVEDVLHGADAVRGRVSTVSLAASAAHFKDLALQFARWGVARICPPGKMQNPPLAWRHDGRPALGELIRWTDCELI